MKNIIIFIVFISGIISCNKETLIPDNYTESAIEIRNTFEDTDCQLDVIEGINIQNSYNHINLPPEIQDRIDSSIPPIEIDLEGVGEEIFVTSFRNTQEKLISVKEEVNLKPLFLYTVQDDVAFYKTIETQEKFLQIHYSCEGMVNYQLFEISTFNEDTENNAAARCFAGSFFGCIITVFDAIDSDRQLSLACIWSGWWCPAAVVVSCALSCIL
jgi:hypothetical protein